LGSWHSRGGRWLRQREKPRGSEVLLPVPGAVVNCESAPIPATLLHISACLCLLFRLSGSLKLLALWPALPCILSPSMLCFCVSPFLALHLLLFHSSHTASFPLSWENCSSRSPSAQQPAAVFGDPLRSAQRCYCSVFSLGLSMRLHLPMFNSLPLWAVLRRFLNSLPMSTFNQFPVCVFYLFLPVLYFIAF